MAPAKIGRSNYTTSAIDRIRQVDKSSIIGFFNELSPKRKLSALNALPIPKGFRPGQRATVDHQLRLLANRLTEDPARSLKNVQRDFDSLGLAWVFWGTEHLGAAEAINDCIDRCSRSEPTEPRQADDLPPDDDPSALDLFRRLQQLSHSNECTREEIERFLEFCPFTTTDRLCGIVETCKPDSEVARDRKLSQLPDRVEAAERDIAGLGRAVDELSKRMEADTHRVSSLHDQVATLHTTVAEGIAKTTSDIGDRLGKIRAEIAANERQSAENAHRQSDFVQAVAASMDKLKDDVTEVVDQIEPLSQRSSKGDKAIETLSADLGQLRDVVAEIRGIVNRISGESTPHTGTSPPPNQIAARPAIALERRPQSSGRPTQLRHVDEFIEAVRTNLEALGIRRSSAEPLALECIAALMVGQMPHFSGVHGTRVAEACATALAAQDTYTLTVPVGILAPNEFRQHLDSLSQGERGHLGCLILDGINRSALDTFGESLVDLVYRRRSGDDASSALLTMATVTEGPASLPISIPHVSLGPLFATDALDWRSRIKAKVQLTCATTSTQDWQRACRIAEHDTLDAEEARRLLSRFVSLPNPLLRGTVLSGLRALSALRQDREGPTPLQSLAFGWIAPLCIAAGVSADDVDQELDQGTVDGTARTYLKITTYNLEF